ncbi:hypothetical protein [Pseudooceanicola algae]|uniref:Uncharacterized protein n=1 Tax=Pseudooceanicola algae TaxID=1537215 RepID=A0A418SH63_9RHOB|nr:hypothetical protein [Pseudooceanicola algae]QPM90390.1 hypothetical protein PSAL_016280 [Pseudooceanicola algae]
MARVIFALLVVAGLVALSTALLAALGRNRRDTGQAEVVLRRTTPLQNLAYLLLILIMTGAATGLMVLE